MKKLLYTSIMIIFIIACRKQPELDKLSTSPIVITNHDPSTNFGSYKTYYISDSVRLISDSSTDTIASSSIGDPIVNAIVSNMNANGYTRVSAPSSADLGLHTAVITITSTVTAYPPYYWWYYSYYGGCYYGYCGYYPYYGYGYYSYEYTTGSLVVEIADLINIREQQIPVIWTNWNTGVLGSSTSINTQAAVNSINKAFEQSPYLKIN